MRPFAHFLTIARHRRLVRKYCFRLGLFRQGLTHDLSKYAPAEFFVGARYFRGDDSPNFTERRENGLGYSEAWLRHKGRNKHHVDYWLDYCLQPDGSFAFQSCRMPLPYVAEMFCDRLAANQVYHGKNYTDAMPYEYFARTKDKLPIHPDTCAEIEKMLLILRDEGADTAFDYIKKRLNDEKRSAR